jgi:hypothetical protein
MQHQAWRRESHIARAACGMILRNAGSVYREGNAEVDLRRTPRPLTSYLDEASKAAMQDALRFRRPELPE